MPPVHQQDEDGENEQGPLHGPLLATPRKQRHPHGPKPRTGMSKLNAG